MKNTLLLHGIGDSPDSFWFPYMERELEKKGFSVWAPQLPQAEKPQVAVQRPFLLEYGRFTSETVLIAHSSACPLSLALLEKLKQHIKQTIFVSGFALPLTIDPTPNTVLQKEYKWDVIKNNVKDFIFINSDNDPWGCDDKQGRYMFDHLGGTLIIRHGEGHMGSNVYSQPYKEFPFLLKLVE